MEWGEGTGGGRTTRFIDPGSEMRWGANERIQKNKIKCLKIEIK